jgi:hypothetical protein
MWHQRGARTWLGVGAAGLVILSGAGAALAASGGSVPPPVGTPSVAQAETISTSLTDQFGTFRRARQTTDSLPAWAAAELNTGPGAAAGANPALSRSADLGSAGTMYLVPGNAQMCIIAPGAGGCASDATLSTDTVGMNHLGTDPPGTIRITGIVPDDVTAVTITMASGPAVHAVLNNNAYGAVVS